MPISDQLKAAIKNSGQTVYAVAKAAEINPDPIYRFLSGERGLRLETADRIAEVLGLELKPKKKK